MRLLSLLAASVTALSVAHLCAFADDMPDVSAKAAVVMDAESGELVFSKNAKLRLPMASTTKIMSALIVLEQDGLDEPFTVDVRAVDTEGSTMGLEKGDRVTLRELCAGMLLPSGNDAANAAAYRVSGSIEGFVELMNEKAQKMGLSDTHFVTPSGLDDYTDDHYSSAADMASLAAFAVKNEDFRAVCSKGSMSLPVSGKKLYNTNKLLGSCEGVFGVKTGFTDKAGRCLVSACERKGKTLVCVTLNDRDDWADHKALYDACFALYKEQTLPFSDRELDVPVVGSECESVKARVTDPTAVLLSGRAGKLETRVYVLPFAYAPVRKGDVLGYVDHYYMGSFIGRRKICALSTAPVLEAKKDDSGFGIDDVLSLLF
ncbi:MAG: D-alanyl-D-alanine carboxypeptidase [Ruminococcus sp.]|nr:D-alanyl-D-alanine carboxypeptidase [Ruminococcus sp.]